MTESKKIGVFKIIVMIAAALYGAAEAFIGLRFLGLPRVLADLGFPYSQIAQMPQFIRPVNIIGSALLVISVIFLASAVLLILKGGIGRILLLVASIAQVVFLAALIFFYITKVIPLAGEVAMLFGVANTPWYLAPVTIVLLGEAIALIPEAFVVVSLLKRSRGHLA